MPPILVNILIVLVLLIIIALIVWYVVAQKKKGVKCIGCPHAKAACNKNSNCGCKK